MWQCSQQHENRDGAKFCAKCGERRVETVLCSACGTKLEPEDDFCTSCGLKRGGQPISETVASPKVEIPATAPPVIAAAPVVAAVPVAPPAPAVSAPAAEPFRFNFGGAVIEATDEPKKVKKSGKGPMTTAMLSFVLFAVLLVIALYLASR